MSLVFQRAAATTALTLDGTTSVPGALTKPTGNNNAMVACVLNTHTGPIFIDFGASGVVASAADAPVAAGERAFFMVPANATHAAVVALGAATAVVYVSLGYASNAH